MRSIDADTLTSILEQWEEKACDGTENDGSDGTTRVLHPVPTTTSEVIDLIADQPTIDPAPRWIPVTERLPELIPCNAGTAYSEAVIVWTDGKKAMIAVWDGIDFLCAADYWEAWGEDITHWMPLPEPPKDGGAGHADR